MPINDKVKIREEKIITNEVLTNSVAQFLYICDVFGASRTLADLMIEITKEENEGIISSIEAREYRVDALRLLNNAEKRCKCFEIKDIF